MQKCRMTELQWKSALYQLRSRLVSGELIGGTKLRASHLAAEMGISRTPIGEALIKLEGEGLLVRDKSGFTVRTFALNDVFDAIDLRGSLKELLCKRQLREESMNRKSRHSKRFWLTLIKLSLMGKSLSTINSILISIVA